MELKLGFTSWNVHEILCITEESNKTVGAEYFCIFTTLIRGGIPKDLHFNVRIITNKGRQQCYANY